MTRAGFVGMAGRPNAGKTTLVNAIVGAHVAIVSERPQTTRRAIRGVATEEKAGWQLVLTDLPGVQRPRDALTERMQRRVEAEIADSDAVLFVVNGAEGVGPGDRFISKALLSANADTPVLCAVNKADRINNAEMADIMGALDVVLRPFSAADAELRITSVVADADGNLTVAWSDARNMAPRAPGSIPENVPPDIVAPGQGIIMAEASFTYTSLAGMYLTGGMTVSDTFYLKPRRSTTVERQ